MARFLIIDDSLLARYTHGHLLEEMGHESSEACNGREGLDLMKQTTFDAVLVDMMMPEMDGIAFLKALKDQGTTLPVIVLSADIQDSKRKECLALGAIAFLEKPAKKQKLGDVLRKILSS